MAEKSDLAVDFYYKMRAALTGRQDRDSKRRLKQQSQRSRPFDTGRSPKTASSTLDALVQSFGWQGKVAEGDLFANWKLIVGDRVAENSFPEEYKKGILTIRCKSTAWATQLKLMSEEIQSKIAERTPDLEVKELRIIGPQAPSFKRGLRSVPGRGPRDTFG